MGDKKPNSKRSENTANKQNNKAESRTSEWIIVVLASLLLPFMVLAAWVMGTLLNTENYLSVVGPLSYNPTVASAVTDYVTTQANQEERIENAISNALPENAEILTGPLTNMVLEFSQTQINRIVTSEVFNRFWVEANRIAHQRIANLVLGKSPVLSLEEGRVVLDISQGIDTVKDRLGIKGLNIVEQLAPNLGSRQIVIFQAPRLANWQQLTALVQPLAVILPVVIVGLNWFAVKRSPNKRTTLSRIGIGGSVAMAILFLLVLAGRDYYINQSFRLPFTPEVAAVIYDAFTRSLLLFSGLLFGLGLVVAYISRKRT